MLRNSFQRTAFEIIGQGGKHTENPGSTGARELWNVAFGFYSMLLLQLRFGKPLVLVVAFCVQAKQF